jgi:hypothetical protein
VALGEPGALGVLVHDEEIAAGIGAGEEEDGVMGEAVVEGDEPFADAGFVEVAAEGG